MALSRTPVGTLVALIWYLFAIITVLTAAGFGAARLLLPTANRYTSQVEQQVVDFVGQPVAISSLDAEWKGFTPMLVLKDVVIYRKDKSKVVMRFPKIRVGLDLFDSLVNLSVVLSRFDLIGANLFLRRNVAGDVEITGLEIDGASESDLDSSLLKDWLFSRERLSLELHNLVFTDNFKKKKVYLLSNVHLMMRNDGDRHIVDAAVKFSGQRNKELVVSIDSRGDFLDLNNWNGEFYTSGKSLSVSDLIDLDETLANRFQLGTFNHEIWVSIKKSQISKVQANIATKNVSFTPIVIDGAEPKQIKFEALAGEFLWQQEDTGWVFNAREFVMKKSSGYWPKSTFSVSYSNDDNKPSIQVNMGYLQVDDVLEMVSAFDENDGSIISKFVAAQPSGVAKDLYFKSSLDDNKVFQGFAKLESFAANVADGEFSFSGLDGKAYVSNTAGSLRVNSKNLKLTIPSIFSNPLPVYGTDADLKWTISDKDIDIELKKITLKNTDASLSGRLALKWPLNGKPATIDMFADIKWANGESVYTYLPHKILSSATNVWLKNAFKKMVVTQGTAVLKGKLGEFPYDNGNGKFTIKFHAAKGILNYADQWPNISNISADVTFDSKSMYIKFDKATMLSSTLNDVTVEIPDMAVSPVIVKIAGNVKGETQAKINYFMASPPLNEKYGSFLKNIKTRGDSDLALKIELGLGDDIDAQVQGSMNLTDNELDLRGLGNVLTKTTGRIEIAKKGFKAKNITTKLLGQDTIVNINTKSMLEKGQRDDFVLVHAKGDISASEVSRRYVPVMQDLWSGKSNLDLKISIPLNIYDRNVRGDKGVEVMLDTFLEGIDIRLPKPYDKAANEKLHLTSTITLAENDRILYRTRYGGFFDSLIEYNNSSIIDVPGARVRGEVRFGSGFAVLPTLPGIRLVGELDELKVDIWKNLIDQLEITPKESSLRASSPDPQLKTIAQHSSEVKLVHSADITVKKFDAWGQRAENLHLIVKNVSQGLYAELDSRAIKGKINIPNDIAADPVDMDFEYINLNEYKDDVGGGSADPRKFPSIQARSKSVTYKGKNFGSVELAVTKLTEGIRIEKLYVRPNATDISGHGSWLLVNGKPMSNFEFHLESKDLGATMIDLGYINTIKGGVGKVDVKTSWPGGLTELNVGQLDGEVHFVLKEGQLLDYDPLGGASILGLFSIQTLPRRLFLDFSDLVDKGLSFNSITGDVVIEDGDAYTTNFKMQGPIVGASLAGRIGLANQDYDQKVKVELRVSDILSFVGLLVASPWAVILPQLLKDEFNSASVLEYSLGGSWNNPKLEPIVPLELPEEEEIGGE